MNLDKMSRVYELGWYLLGLFWEPQKQLLDWKLLMSRLVLESGMTIYGAWDFPGFIMNSTTSLETSTVGHSTRQAVINGTNFNVKKIEVDEE